ncbi:MAG: hypothetical protein ACK4UN_04720 [Limisphaerales bacterium]
MRKFIHRVQDLSKKAGELQKTVQSMPGKAAELRQAVVMSAGELQQIRSDVQSNINGLRANSEDRLLQAMREINDHTYTFEEAGYELTGMDLDLAITQRLAVQFNRFEDVSLSTLQSLLAKQTKDVIKSILTGIIKAEETAANVELTHLKYDGVIVDIGAVPLIRMLWRSDTFVEQQDTVIETVQSAPAPAVVASAAPSGSPVSSSPFGSFFEPRPAPIAASSPAPVENSVTPSPEPIRIEVPAAKPQTAASPAETTKQSALERFKKMPDLSKSRY